MIDSYFGTDEMKFVNGIVTPTTRLILIRANPNIGTKA